MELTLDNLIIVITEKLGFDDVEITKDTFLSTYIDGLDVVDLLNDLAQEFEVLFDNFEIERYFHSEIEITRSISFLNLFRLRKIRKVEKLTIGELYEYMIKNRKLD